MPGSRYATVPLLTSIPPGYRPGESSQSVSLEAPVAASLQVRGTSSVGGCDPPGQFFGTASGAPEPFQTGGAAIAGFVGAGRFRSGSGSANEFSTLLQVMGGPLPWSWIRPTERHVASSAMTSIVL